MKEEQAEKFLEHVRTIVEYSKENINNNTLNDNILKTIENLRKFLDYASAFIEIDAEVLDEMVSIYPPFCEEVIEIKKEKGITNQKAQKIMNTSNTTYSSFPRSYENTSSNSSSCGSQRTRSYSSSSCGSTWGSSSSC